MIPKFLDCSLCTYSERRAGSPCRTQLRLWKTHRELGRRQDDNAVTRPVTPHPVPAALLGAVGSTRVLGLIGPHHLRGNRVTSGGLHRPIACSRPQRFVVALDLASDPGPGLRGKQLGSALCSVSGFAPGLCRLGLDSPCKHTIFSIWNSVYFGSWDMRSILSLIRSSKQTFSIKKRRWRGRMGVSRLNRVPQKRHVAVLTPRTSERDLM